VERTGVVFSTAVKEKGAMGENDGEGPYRGNAITRANRGKRLDVDSYRRGSTTASKANSYWRRQLRCKNTATEKGLRRG